MVYKLKNISEYTAPKKLDTFGGIFYDNKIKYNISFKLHCVKKVLENHCSVNLVSDQEGISDSLLHKWIIDCQKQGILG